MDQLQDFLTLAATVIEYFFFAYLSIALMVYSLKLPSPTQSVRSIAIAQTRWQRSVDFKPSASLAPIAG